MRILCPAMLSLLVVSAVPSVSFAQKVLTPFQSNPGPTYDERLDHAVPVATVSRVGDIVALEGARVVDDGHGAPFILGAATFDLTDPAHAKVLFTMTNAVETAILLDDVVIEEVRLCSVPDPDHPFGYPGTSGRAGGFHGTGEMQPGEKATVQIPIAPNCMKGSQTVAVVVDVHRPGPREFSSTPRPNGISEFHATPELIFRVLDKLRAEASHP